MLAYARETGIDAHRRALGGDRGNEEFFVLTKRIHNFLHGSSGDGGDLDNDARRVFDEVTERNASPGKCDNRIRTHTSFSVPECCTQR